MGSSLFELENYLGNVLLHALVICVHDAQVEMRLHLRMALVGRSAIPFCRLGVVPLHALAFGINDAQALLRRRITLLGCSVEPVVGRLGIVLLHALAIAIRLIFALAIAIRLIFMGSCPTQRPSPSSTRH